MLFGRKGSRRTFLFTFGERIGCLRRWLQICIQPYRRTTDVDGCSRYGTAGITAPAESLACPLANELDNWNASSARSSNWKEGYGYTVATEMYSAGIDRLTHQPLSFSVSETTEGVHIHIIDAELMGKGEKEKKTSTSKEYRTTASSTTMSILSIVKGR